MIGKTISHYKILEKLGAGGMGEVYKAQDTKLKRAVALKFLPPELTRNPAANKRFVREAQAASALEHNNICNIHEINETEDGRLFIAMACYEGQTLKQKLSDGPLSVNQAVNIAVQIAHGLSRAHEEGIVHRDIKPANIFITDRDEVKILDFGLVKLAGPVQLTKDTSTLGTVAYMSPEQCSGGKLDSRTDIWSLGVVLYEMLTGKLPFKGDYEQAIIYAILNEKPDRVSKHKSGLSKEIENIVHKILNKNPDKRYQSADELISDLKTYQKTQPLLPEGQKSLIGRSKRLPTVLVGTLLIMLVAMGFLLTRPRKSQKFQIHHTSPLTTAPGLEQDPTWSPEGTRIAYTSDESGNMDIWVRQITAGQKVNLTKDYTGYDGKPAWSPDGEWIAFISEREGGGIFLMSAMGGAATRIITISFELSLSRIGSIPDISWSPDGTELTYAVAGSVYTILVSEGITSEVPLPSSGLIGGYSEPAWSPDGSRIICTGIVALGVSTSQIWSLHRNESDPVPVTEGKYLDHNPVWSADGKRIFFISDRGGNFDVWWIPVNARGESTGSALPLTTGAGVGAIALYQNGAKLAYTKIIESANIWSIPIVTNHKIKLDEALSHTSENLYIENIGISPDGQWIAFDSNRQGNMDIWIMHKDGSRLRALTSNPAHDWYPRWSPDGKEILFHSMQTGNRDLFTIPVAGGALKQLTHHPGQDFAGNWGPDGQRIGFTSNRSGNMDIWMMDRNSSSMKQITFLEGQDIVTLWSPAGDEIVFATNRTGNFELFRMQVEQLFSSENEDNAIQLTHCEWASVNPVYWSADGKTIFTHAVGGPDNIGTNLWAVSAEDGSAQPLLDLQSSLKEPLHTGASDGERFYFTLWERIGDLWMAELSTAE